MEELSTIEFLPYKRLFRYPHLLPVDAHLWDRFIRFYPDYFDKVAYDIHLGKGVRTPDDFDPKLRSLAVFLTQKRLDVLGVNGRDVTIIELKPYAGTTALGQLLTYQVLFYHQYPRLSVPQLMIITDMVQPDMAVVCKHHKIKVVEVGAVPT